MKPRSERLIVAALALVVTYAFFYQYLPPFKRFHLFSDIEGYHYPLQRYAFQALKEGRFPQWDPSIYSGISFVGNIQAAVLYPPTWLMYAASWRQERIPFKMLEVFAFAHVWLGFSEVELDQMLAGAGFERIELSTVSREKQAPHFQTILATAVKP